jgi:type I restriction enzyme, S subunit
MKNGWKTEPLGELCEFQRGLTYAKGDEVDVSENVVLRATNIDLTTNLLNLDELKYINDKVVVPDSRKVKKGSLMICTASGSKSHLGKVAYIDDDYGYAFGGFMGMVTPKKGLLPKYLFHLMTSDAYKEFIGELSDGTNINNLKFDDLKKFQVPHPNPDEQVRIVGLLDEAFEGIAIAKANAERNLQNARALFESHLESVFTQRGKGWVGRKLGDESLLEIIDGDRGVNYPNGADFQDEGYCLFMNTKNVRPDGFVFESTMFITKEKDGQLRKGKLKRDDVVLTTRGTIGNVGIYDEDVPFDNIRINSGMLVFRPNTRALLPSYLFEMFRSEIMKEQIRKETTGAAQPQLPIKTLVNFTIPVPTNLDDQQAVVKKLRAFEPETQRLASLYERKLKALEALRKSLLHQAFTGNL